jgi:hypothetical protein
MLLHIDGSRHRWFQDERWYDLIVILDDATTEIYYAQLVEEESTATVMVGLREVIERKGLFCALYSDRGSHFWLTPKAGGKVDPHRPTQLGRALRELGVQMIPAYSPQARGRSERNFGTWQGRLPQELRLRGINSVTAANDFLRDEYIAEFNRRFQVPAAQRGNAFVACHRRDLDLVFSLQFERSVNRDNTVSFQNLVLQRNRTSAPGRNSEHQLRTTPARTLHGSGLPNHANGGTRGGGKDAGSAALENASRFPLSHRHDGCGRLTKPDISLATKTGHFNLLRTASGTEDRPWHRFRSPSRRPTASAAPAYPALFPRRKSSTS